MEPEEVIQVGFEECIEQTLSEKAFLYVWDFQDNKFRVKDTFGLEELEPNEEYQRVESLLLESAREMSFLHVFFVPVIYQEQTVAVMILGSPEPFDDRKQETCAVISSHVTIGYEVSLQGETLREYLASLEKEKEQISSSHIIVDKEAFYQLDSSLLSLQNRLDALLEKSPSQWSGKASELADLREVAESLTGLLRENKLKQQSAARKMPQTETIDV